jgi:predicted aspartyl protease
MGTFNHFIEVAAREGGPYTVVEGLVDTGATYSLFPRLLLGRLGATPHDHAEFSLADGTVVTREFATVVVRLDGKIRHVLCIVGEEPGDVLIGATTLELCGLMADPVNRRLVPAPLYLKKLAPARCAAWDRERPAARRRAG